MASQRLYVIASASGSGKTTLARLAADQMGVRCTYTEKLGDLVLRAADEIVWLDLPISTWMSRLIRRTVRRLLTREELWNGNRESLRSAIAGRDSLFVHALRTHFERRRHWPMALQPFPVVRLRSAKEVSGWLQDREGRLGSSASDR